MRLAIARAALGAIVLSVLGAQPVTAQQLATGAQPPPGRFGVSGAIGASWPIDDVAADVYGTMWPISVQGDIRLARRLAVFAGFKSIRADGQSIVLGTPVADERYLTSLSVASLRLGATFEFPLVGRLAAAGSVGLAVNWFEEQWPEAQATEKGHPADPVVQGELRYALSGRWSVLGRLEYAPIRAASAASTSGSTINLGGVDVAAGIRVGF